MLGFGGLLIVVCWARCGGGWQAMLRLVVIGCICAVCGVWHL